MVESISQTLESLPIAPGVRVHSIIAVDGDGPPEGGSDGVVEYRSAHLDGCRLRGRRAFKPLDPVDARDHEGVRRSLYERLKSA